MNIKKLLKMIGILINVSNIKKLFFITQNRYFYYYFIYYLYLIFFNMFVLFVLDK